MVERDGKERSAACCRRMVEAVVRPQRAPWHPWHPCAVSLRSCSVECSDSKRTYTLETLSNLSTNYSHK